MDLNILLWIGGMLFSLGIFAVKVGFGLAFGRSSVKEVAVILGMYLVLFVVVSVLSDRLLKVLEPILRQGPYLHALMAVGMIAWGMYLLHKENKATGQMMTACAKTKKSGLSYEMHNFSDVDKVSIKPLTTSGHSLALLIPCPVCLTAMTFSIWSALNVTKWHPLWVGLSVGAVFSVFSGTIYLLIKAIPQRQTSLTHQLRLALAMITVGIYFIASLYIPAKIEEAKLAYSAFVTETQLVDPNQQIEVFGLLALFFVVGFFIFRPQGDGK